MKKYQNLSGNNIGFILDGKTYDFQNGQIIEVPNNFQERLTNVISKIIPFEEKKSVVETISVKPTVTIELEPSGLIDCLVCGKLFKPSRKSQKYCSSKCQKSRRLIK